MSEGANQNWGRKGKAIGIVLSIMFLFFILLIYVYNHAQNAAPIG